MKGSFGFWSYGCVCECVCNAKALRLKKKGSWELEVDIRYLAGTRLGDLGPVL